MKRKIIAAVLILAIIASLASCAASRTPEETVTAALDAIKSEQYAKCAKLFVIGEDIQAKITEYIENDQIPFELVRAFVDKMTYTVQSATISEDETTAEVIVQVTNISAAKSIIAHSGDLLALTASSDFVNADEASQNQMIVQLLAGIFTDPDVDMGVTKSTVTLTKSDGAWKIPITTDEQMYSFCDVYLGGAYAAFSGFIDIFS